ncbi:hypothetical protein V6N11_006740 [Hibiscus sabdariffa]|uniref:Uncharacterized protein n=1 Tax=Hibiscus sabdariffa TaxID=183260 RepID=A0ABR2RRP9_9ROSI
MCNSQERCSIGEQKQGYWIPQESPARTTRASSPACCFFRDNFFGFTKKTSTILTQLNHLPNWKRIELHVKSSASEATSIGYHRDKSNHVWPKEKVNNLYTGADDGTSTSNNLKEKGICRNRFYNATCHYSSLGKLLRVEIDSPDLGVELVTVIENELKIGVQIGKGHSEFQILVARGINSKWGNMLANPNKDHVIYEGRRRCIYEGCISFELHG